MRYSSGVRFSRAKPVGSFRVLQPSTRAVASHDETLKDARKSAAYWTSSVSSPMEIQRRFPSGDWVTIQVVQPKSQRARAKRSYATVKTAEGRVLKCDMSKTCEEPVTHLDEKGFVYCTKHGIQRRGSGHRCRKLSSSELNQLKRGETLARY